MSNPTIVYSTRLPGQENGKVKGAGGLVQALNEALEGRKANEDGTTKQPDMWFGSEPLSAEKMEEMAPVFEKTGGFMPDTALTHKGAEVKGIPLQEELHAIHRSEVALPFMWPGGHGLEDIVNNNIEQNAADPNFQKNMNNKFKALYTNSSHVAAAIKKQLAKPGYEDSEIAVQDYDNVAIGYELKRIGVKNPISWFNHTPVPTLEELDNMKINDQPALENAGVKEYFLRLAVGYDSLGFQTNKDKHNLLNIYKRIDKGFKEIDKERNLYNIAGNHISVKAFPIGIDPENTNQEALTEMAKQAEPTGPVSMADLGNDEKGVPANAKHVRKAFEGKKLMISFGRNDYTKGVREQIAIIDSFFKKNAGTPEADNTAFFFQLEKTRSGSKDFDENQRKMEELTDAMEEKYPGRFKVIYGRRPHEDCMALCRVADGNWALPIKDGMNLTVKESVAAKEGHEDPGVLIVSEGMGAAEEFSPRGATVVRGLKKLKDCPLFKYDDDNVLVTDSKGGPVLDIDPKSQVVVNAAVDKLEKTLALSLERRKDIHARLHQELNDHDIGTWMKRQQLTLGKMNIYKQRRATEDIKTAVRENVPHLDQSERAAFMKRTQAARVLRLGIHFDYKDGVVNQHEAKNQEDVEYAKAKAPILAKAVSVRKDKLR